MSKASDTTRAILQAYGYTTRTLALDLDVSYSVARRILHGNNGLSFGDIILLSNALEVSPNFLCPFGEPGTLRERKQELAEKRRVSA